jgi:hypothetical protein
MAVLESIIAVVGTLLGTVVGLAVEPIKARFTDEAKKNSLRRALYSEIVHFYKQARLRLEFCNNSCKDTPDWFRVPDKVSVFGGPLSIKVYDSVKTDPISFYQLEDGPAIDDTYDALKSINYQFNILLTTSYDSPEMPTYLCGQIGKLLENLPKQVGANMDIDRATLRKVGGGDLIGGTWIDDESVAKAKREHEIDLDKSAELWSKWQKKWWQFWKK